MRVLVLTYWSYSDALIQTYTLPYVRIMLKHMPSGSKVWLQTLEQPNRALGVLEAEQARTKLVSEGIYWYPLAYRPFGIGMAMRAVGYLWQLADLIRRERIDGLHSWCTPAGGLGWMLSRWTGRPLVIDSFEPHAEPMLESGTWSRGGMAFKILLQLEKMQLQHAREVIACVASMRQYSREKYGIDRAMHVKPACIDLEQFSYTHKDLALEAELGLAGYTVGCYVGKFGGSYLSQEIFSFFQAFSELCHGPFKVLILSPHERCEIDALAHQAGMTPGQIVLRFVSPWEVPRYLSLGDFGMTPFIPVPSKRYGTPLKTGEYLASGLPVVITPGISDDSETIARERAGVILDRLDVSGYRLAAKALNDLLEQESRPQRVARIGSFRWFLRL